MSSGVTLSNAVRQNLLSLQNTAQLASITQNRLSTGKKVNSALDNPVNFFTASGLDARANDISNLLDSIGNGVQVLKAADTGITSLTNLIGTAKSIANQALQTSIGYTTKSNVSTTIGGATSSDLRGTTTYTSATAASNVLFDGTAGGTHAATSATTLGVATAKVGAVTGSAVSDNIGPTLITTATALYGPTGGGAGTGGLTTQAATTFTDGTTFSVNGHSITFKAGAAPVAASAPTGYGVNGNIATDGNGNSIIYLGTGTQSSATVGDVLSAIDLASGVASATISAGAATITTPNSSQTASNITAGAITLRSSTGADLSVTGKADALKALGLTTATGSGNATVSAARQTSSTSLGTLITDGSTLNVNGKTITFKNAATPAAANVPTGSGVTSGNVVTDGNGNSTVYLEKGTVADVLNAIDLATGVQTASNSGGNATLSTAAGATNSSIAASGALQISTGTNSDLSISGTGNALAALGLNGNTGTATTFTASRTAGAGSISGKTLTFTSFNGGTAVNITFGDGTGGTVKTLDQLNTALSANNLTATVDTTGKLTIAASNDYASSTLGSVAAGGTIGGTLTSTLSFTTAAAPVADPNSSSARAGLVSQFNNILSQITTTAQDSSFNGVNLLNGDTLKLVFNEKATSTLSITGVSFTASGLGLSNLTAGTDLVDNASTNKVLASLDQASTTLRSQASTFGSNLSVVQNRQDFSTNLINVLQTGSSNLTLADTNEEGANLLALQTRQQLSISSLSLASQADQAILKIL
jgi:flagellin